MVHSAKTFGAKLLFALSIPLLVLASLPLGLYAFFLYAKGIVDTIRGRKPSIVTEFDEVKRQGPSSFPDPFGANPIPQGVINSNNTIDSHDVTNSNNTTQTTNYYFN